MMKKFNIFGSLPLLCTFCLISFIGCYKEDVTKHLLQKEPQFVSPVKVFPNKVGIASMSSSISSVGSGYTCGKGAIYLNDSYAANTYQVNIDLSGVAIGTTVTLVASPVDVPNRFAVKSGSTTLVQSGWRGYSTTSGPWGSSLNVPGDYIATFTRGSATVYTVYVETVVAVNEVDSWNASIYCNSGSTPPTTGTPIYHCGSSMIYLNDSYAANGVPGAHTYQKNIDLSGVDIGKTVTLVASPVDVPNRFAVKSGSTTLVQSGWRGYSTTSGPWGSSLNVPGDYIATFTRGSATVYTVYVETVVAVNEVDSWNASIYCNK
jgi:hypothetical protein